MQQIFLFVMMHAGACLGLKLNAWPFSVSDPQSGYHLTIISQKADAANAIAQVTSAQTNDLNVIILKTANPELIHEVLKARSLGSRSRGSFNNSTKIIVYSGHSYLPSRDSFCWMGGCIDGKNPDGVDAMMIYNNQAVNMFPRVSHKFFWFPVSWDGTGGTAAPLAVTDLQKIWKQTHVRSCQHIISLGGANRDRSGLLAAYREKQKTNQWPKLVILSAPNDIIHECQKYNSCMAYGHHALSKSDYAKLLENACLVIVPITLAEHKYGAGLTGVSEAFSYGKIPIVTTDENNAGIANIGSQWDQYVVHAENGMVLHRNDADAWSNILDDFVNRPDFWQQLESRTREHALNHFSAEAVQENLDKMIQSLISRNTNMLSKKTIRTNAVPSLVYNSSHTDLRNQNEFTVDKECKILTEPLMETQVAHIVFKRISTDDGQRCGTLTFPHSKPLGEALGLLSREAEDNWGQEGIVFFHSDHQRMITWSDTLEQLGVGVNGTLYLDVFDESDMW